MSFDQYDPSTLALLRGLSTALKQTAPSVPPSSISTLIHNPLPNQAILTTIKNPAITYTTLAEQLVLGIHNQCKLLPLLETIHPENKLTAYKLLFGNLRCIIVKPMWDSDNVVDGCVDVNVYLRYRNGGESFMDTPNISILKTLPTRYHIRRESDEDRQEEDVVVDMELVFYRIAKDHDPISPFARTDSKTTFIMLEEGFTFEGNMDNILTSVVKGWNVDDEDCTLPSYWVCEFQMTEGEHDTMKRYLEERDMEDVYSEHRQK